MDDKKEDMLLEKQRWANRRRMAWLALIAMIWATAAMMFYVDITRIELLDNLVEMFYLTMASIIGAYMGFTAWTHVRSTATTRTQTEAEAETKTTTVKKDE